MALCSSQSVLVADWQVCRRAMAAASSVEGEVPLWQRPRAERYLKLEHVGSGSFGRVSLAVDLLTNRRVAIKKQDVSSKMSQREFGFLSALGAHPCAHVACMLDYFVSKDQKGGHFLQTIHPLADSTLWNVFKFSRGDLSDARVAKYMFGVATGLSHLNMLGIVHADASLKNMLLTREDQVQVADLGSAFSAMEAMGGKGEITTVYVRSPERLLGERVVQASIDVWAFGVQLFCLRSGQCPWLELQGGDDTALHSAMLFEITKLLGPVPLDSALRQLPRWPTLSKGAVQNVQPSKLFEGWSSEARGLCSLAMCWSPADRATWERILSSDLFVLTGAKRDSREPLLSSDGLVPREEGPSASNTPASPHCQCLGNCGSLVHKKRGNLRYRRGSTIVVCDGVVASGQKYCDRCRCERAGCAKLRLQDNKRWCQEHACIVKHGQYIVPSGVHSFGRSWPPLVRAVARLAHLFPFCVPEDILVLQDLVAKFGVINLGESLDPTKFAWLFIAHVAKWPPVVKEWCRMLDLDRPSTGLALAEKFKALIQWCDQRDGGDMFDRMNGTHSLMDAQPGLLVHATRMQLVSRAPLEKSSRGHALGEEPEAKRKCLTMGRKRAEVYELTDATPVVEILDFLLTATAEQGLCWPANSEEVPPFADCVLELIQRIRDFKPPTGSATLMGGSKRWIYCAKHLLRVLLLCIETRLPGAFQDIPFKRIMEWCPDSNKHASAFNENITGSFIQEKFGCSPLMWSCWACLVGFAQPHTIAESIKVDHSVIWKRFVQLEATMGDIQDGGFMPGPHVLLQALQ